MATQRRLWSIWKWLGTSLSGLIVLAGLACVLWDRVTVATGVFSEVGLRGGALISLSWHGADWPRAEYWQISVPDGTADECASAWAQDGIWPSWGRDGNERWTIIPLWIPFALVFPATVCLWRDPRKWAVIALVCFAAVLLATRVAARYFYDAYWPGHPDSFRAETALLPGLSFYHSGDYFWQNRQQALIFLSACCVFVIPPIVGLALARGRVVAALIVVASLSVLASAIYDVWQRWDSWVWLIYGPLSRRPALLDAAWRDVAWVAGLSMGGLLIACAIYRIMARRQTPPGRCPACGYDLRVQAALQIPRCPECGRALMV